MKNSSEKKSVPAKRAVKKLEDSSMKKVKGGFAKLPPNKTNNTLHTVDSKALGS